MPEPSSSPHPGTRPRHRRPRTSRPAVWVVVGVVGVLLLVAAGYVVTRVSTPDQTSAGQTSAGQTGGAGSASPTPTPTPTPSTTVSTGPSPRRDLRALVVPRGPFCGRLDGAGVERVLAAPVASVEEYGDGDRVQLAPGLRDVAHEDDCTYRGGTGTQARVWVFDAPVSRTEARSIVRSSRARPGCRVLAGGPVFGAPSAATTCPVADPRGRSVTLRGRFGRTWLTCQLRVTATRTPGDREGGSGHDRVRDTVRRTQRWCVQVATRLAEAA